jgi:hypothetical protein
MVSADVPAIERSKVRLNIAVSLVVGAVASRSEMYVNSTNRKMWKIPPLPERKSRIKQLARRAFSRCGLSSQNLHFRRRQAGRELEIRDKGIGRFHRCRSVRCYESLDACA